MLLPLVCRRTVGAGDGNVEQPKIDGQLTAMMNQVAEGEVTEHIGLGLLEPRSTRDLELPWLAQIGVNRSRQGAFTCGGPFIEGSE